MNNTKIEYCDKTFNPVTGCLRGCSYCYAREIAHRFGGWDRTPGSARMNIAEDKTYIHPMKSYYGEAKETEHGIIADINGPFILNGKKAPFPFGFTPTFHRYRLGEPAKVKKPQTIFVGSMTDLFADDIPDKWIMAVFEACAAAPQHRYLFLTKRPHRYLSLHLKGRLLNELNIWYGTTITESGILPFNALDYSNIYISVEPLLGEMSDRFPFTNVGWVIVGSMTGPRASKHKPKREWIENIAEQCRAANVPLFMKNSLRGLMGDAFTQETPW